MDRREYIDAVRAAGLGRAAGLIARDLALAADPGTCEFSNGFVVYVKTLMNWTGLSDRSVTAAFAELETAGLLEVCRANGKRSEYRLVIKEPTTELTSGVMTETPEVSSVVPPKLLRETPEATSGLLNKSYKQTNKQTSADARGEKKSKKTTTPVSAKKTKPKTEPDREDVNQVCRALWSAINARGGRVPKQGSTALQGWKREARLLLDGTRDYDPVRLDEALRVVAWCQRDPFWRDNILSTGKLRQQYSALQVKCAAAGGLRLAAPKAQPVRSKLKPQAQDYGSKREYDAAVAEWEQAA